MKKDFITNYCNYNKYIYYFCTEFELTMAKKAIKTTVKRKKSLRTHPQTFSLNDEENNALNRYISKYNIKNKSKFIRETLMFSVIRKLEENNPTLFD